MRLNLCTSGVFKQIFDMLVKAACTWLSSPRHATLKALSGWLISRCILPGAWWTSELGPQLRDDLQHAGLPTLTTSGASASASHPQAYLT